jgi:tripartite-type tricarboxylate transporter receptor subunit TctC
MKHTRILSMVLLGALSTGVAACGTGGNGDSGQGKANGAAGQDKGKGDCPEGYPEREVTLVIPFPAGSAPDATFRTVSKATEEKLGQQIVILNKPGGGGTVGTAEVLTAKPDGYTVGVGAAATLVLNPQLQNTPFKGPEDFQPVIQVTSTPMAFFVSSESGMKTLDDFVERAKKETLKVGIGGSVQNIIGAQLAEFTKAANIEVSPVPYDAGQQILSVINGTVHAGIGQPSLALPHVQNGTVKILGVFGDKKPEGLEAPLFKDEGYNVTRTGYETVIAPKDVPSGCVQILHDAFKAGMESPEFTQFASKRKVLVDYLGSEELAEKLAADKKAYKQTIDELGWKGGS